MRDSTPHTCWTVSEEACGQRLDAALGFFLPQYGIQARRRLCRNQAVLVNGRPRAGGYKVRAGDSLCVLEIAGEVVDSLAGKVRLVLREEGLVALEKPAGLHTVRVQGSNEQSLEEILPAIWQGLGNADGRLPLLVNRLDKETSGLVLGVLDAELEGRYRQWERAGEAEKTYHALVMGRVDSPMLLTAALDTDNRKKTALLRDREETDPLRHTAVRPLMVYGQGEAVCTLLEVKIRRGARHQIRAHLAGAGFPIAGDVLYEGGPAPDEVLAAGQEKRLFLHHTRLDLPGFRAESPTGWKFRE